MSTTKEPERQYPLIATKELSYSELTTATAVGVIDLPNNAVILGGHAFVKTADNGGTSVSLSVGDSGSGTRYVSALDIKTAADVGASFTTTKLGKVYANGETITVTRTEGGTASTAGVVRVTVVYMILGRGQEVQIGT